MLHLISFVLVAVRPQANPNPPRPVIYKPPVVSGESISPSYRARMAAIRAEMTRTKKSMGEK